MTQKMSEMRADVKKHLEENILVDTMDITYHCPWTIVVFTSLTPDGEEVWCMGVSKVCHPDTWDEDEGRNKAINRAIAWAAREWIAPAVEIANEK
jgi:hypothetical protein